MERRSLGKGLSALIPEKVIDSAIHKEEIIYVQTGQIKANPFQPREVFDQLSIEELAQSIKEKGVNLSVGQQQRLALARGLLACHDKDVVLLDEPTSSLDTATEMKVYRNIFREFREKTIISSIHRLHLLPLFHKMLCTHSQTHTCELSIECVPGNTNNFPGIFPNRCILTIILKLLLIVGISIHKHHFVVFGDSHKLQTATITKRNSISSM